MAKEYIEREKAIEEIKKYVTDGYDTDLDDYENWGDGAVKYILEGLYEAVERLDEVPAVDVVEVVRCKDCLFGHRDYNYRLGYTCEKPLYHPAIGETPHRKLMQDCDYCSFGVRKDRE